MRNVSHAASGALVGLAVAPELGMHTIPAVAAFTVAMAGWATGPDLDCEGATPCNVFGPFGHATSRTIRAYSAWLYRHTEGPRDNHHSAGTHRHATHSPFHCVLAGLIATATTMVGGTFGAVAAITWMILGVALATMALGRAMAVVFAATAASWLIGIPITGHNLLTVTAAHAPWIGLAVGLGCLVHVAGDALTHAGVPMLFPKMINQARWRDFGLLPAPLRFTTGGGFERIAVYPALLTGTVLLIPGVWPALVYTTPIVWTFLAHLPTVIQHA